MGGRVVPLHEDDRWAQRIRSAWQKSVESILETGRLLVEAKAALPHGGFEIMVRDQLPFGLSMAERLMKIARSPVLADPAHGPTLPASWRTLYELTKLDDEELRVGFQKRLIRPELERKDVPGLISKIRRALGRRVISRATAPQSRSFFLDLREQIPAELSARLDTMAPEVRAAVIERVIALIEKEMADG